MCALLHLRTAICLEMAGLYIAHWLSIAPLLLNRAKKISRALYTIVPRGITTYTIQHMPTHPALWGSRC